MVGDVRYSILKESQFQTKFGNFWVRMLGKDVSGSDYSTITGKNNVSDASGRSLRNTGGNAPLLDQTQEDKFKNHSHIGGFTGVNGTASFGIATTTNGGNINQQSGTSV